MVKSKPKTKGFLSLFVSQVAKILAVVFAINAVRNIYNMGNIYMYRYDIVEYDNPKQLMVTAFIGAFIGTVTAVTLVVLDIRANHPDITLDSTKEHVSKHRAVYMWVIVALLFITVRVGLDMYRGKIQNDIQEIFNQQR